MMKEEDKYLPERKSIRLPFYDYSRPAKYFVTICVHRMEHIFGRVVGDGLVPSPKIMQLNATGELAEQIWKMIPEIFKGVVIDDFVIMPNHIHGIIEIMGDGAGTRPARTAKTISDIVGGFKSKFVHEYIMGIRDGRFQSFDGKFWQRGYYEHIIRSRDETDINRIRQYIKDNPKNWDKDELNKNPP